MKYEEELMIAERSSHVVYNPKMVGLRKEFQNAISTFNKEEIKRIEKEMSVLRDKLALEALEIRRKELDESYSEVKAYFASKGKIL